jgi:hypothetical protein
MKRLKPEQYRLLKDLPDLPAGAVFVFVESDDYYQGGEWYVPKGEDENAPDHHKYDPDLVKNTPRWFSPASPPDAA